jgi:folate-dependent phosphoribosylglycinamide formyltransferase PurN
MMEGKRSSETSVLAGVTQRSIPTDTVFHSHRRENLKSYINFVPSSPIPVILMIVAISSSDTSVLSRATRRNIPEDTILHSHRRENFKSYKCLFILQIRLVNISQCSLCATFALKDSFMIIIVFTVLKLFTAGIPIYFHRIMNIKQGSYRSLKT